jgi:hypothetical protein
MCKLFLVIEPFRARAVLWLTRTQGLTILSSSKLPRRTLLKRRNHMCPMQSVKGGRYLLALTKGSSKTCPILKVGQMTMKMALHLRVSISQRRSEGGREDLKR